MHVRDCQFQMRMVWSSDALTILRGRESSRARRGGQQYWGQAQRGTPRRAISKRQTAWPEIAGVATPPRPFLPGRPLRSPPSTHAATHHGYSWWNCTVRM